jgi:hypothetical protein
VASEAEKHLSVGYPDRPALSRSDLPKNGIMGNLPEPWPLGGEFTDNPTLQALPRVILARSIGTIAGPSIVLST